MYLLTLLSFLSLGLLVDGFQNRQKFIIAKQTNAQPPKHRHLDMKSTAASAARDTLAVDLVAKGTSPMILISVLLNDLNSLNFLDITYRGAYLSSSTGYHDFHLSSNVLGFHFFPVGTRVHQKGIWSFLWYQRRRLYSPLLPSYFIFSSLFGFQQFDVLL